MTRDTEITIRGKENVLFQHCLDFLSLPRDAGGDSLLVHLLLASQGVWLFTCRSVRGRLQKRDRPHGGGPPFGENKLEATYEFVSLAKMTRLSNVLFTLEPFNFFS